MPLSFVKRPSLLYKFIVIESPDGSQYKFMLMQVDFIKKKKRKSMIWTFDIIITLAHQITE